MSIDVQKFSEVKKSKIGFNKLSYTLSAMPVIPYLKLQGFASDGISWDDVEVANLTKGADGLGAINQKPCIYQGNFSLLPNSPCRVVLDNLIDLSTVDWGKDAIDYELILTVQNLTTRTTTVYSGGIISTTSGGDTANKDEGQANKTYVVQFAHKNTVPLA